MKATNKRGAIVLPDPKKKVRRLYYDCGWKGESEFRCVICSCRKYTQKTEEDGYDAAKPLIINHILQKHAEYCYSCDHCHDLFTTKSDFQFHTCK